MPRLRANFEADWIAQLRSHLIDVQGWKASEIASLDDREVRFHYFDALRRRIAPKPRTVNIADDFVCSLAQLPGWQILKEKVGKGDDINPHLSKRHASLFNLDGLLNEWGVHHFHLGVAPDPMDPAYMGRTPPLLYALVTDDAFCAINVYSHGSFEDIGIVESIHRNWPHLISRYRAKGVTGSTLSQAQRWALRNKNTNVCLATADGTVYMPISGGVMASGVNAEAVWRADYWHERIRNLQPQFEKQLHEVLPALSQNGYAGEDEIEAELKVSDTPFFPAGW